MLILLLSLCRRMLVYLLHFVLLLVLSTTSIPKFVSKALFVPQWRQAMVVEMTALHDNGTWQLVSLPSDKSLGVVGFLQ